MLNDISQTIRSARKARGMTQQQLAELTQLDRTTIGTLLYHIDLRVRWH